MPILAASVLGSALAMAGAVSSWFVPLGLAIVGAALVLSFSTNRSRTSVAWPAVVLAALAAYSLLQSLPLPVSWVARLSPAAGDIWSRSLLALGRSVSIASLSIDPSASRIEAVKWASYAATFSLAASVGRSRGANVGLGFVFASAVAVALVSLGHAVLGATTVYGLYTPRHAFPSGMGPFLNPNSLAGYLNLGALVGVGLILSRTPIISRWLLGAGLLTVVAVSLRTGSRGGIASLILGMLVFGTWAALSRRAAIASGRVVSIAVSGLLAVAGIFAFVGADSRFWSELLSENAEKLRLPLLTTPMITDFPWFGVGRGGFESAFFAYRPPVGNTAYTHPENFVAQWLTEWGIPVATCALVGMVAALARIRRGANRSALVVGALCGVGALLLQNLADLGLELAAVGIALSVVLGSLWGSVKPPSDQRPARAKPGAWLLRAGLAIGVISGAWSIGNGLTSVDEDRARVKTMIDRAVSERSAPARERLRAEIAQMLAKHPADYYFPLAGAYAARLEGDNPMPWIQRALERGPTIGRTHLLLGEILADRGLINQGLMELRTSVVYEPALASIAARVAVAHTQDGDLLLRSVPDGAAGAAMLDAVAAILPETAADAADRIDAEALSRDEALLNPRRRLLERRLAAVESKRAPCIDPAPCAAFIEDQAAVLARLFPSHTLGARTRARLLRAQGRVAEAADLLLAGCEAPGERAACLLLRVQILGDLEKPAELDAALDAYVGASCTQRKSCAEAHDWVGEFRNGRGNLRQAVSAFEHAARDEPTPERWLKVADAAEKAGLKSTAIDALRQVSALRGKDAAIEKRLSDLQRLQR